jgi:hypothetical protein
MEPCTHCTLQAAGHTYSLHGTRHRKLRAVWNKKNGTRHTELLTIHNRSGTHRMEHCTNYSLHAACNEVLTAWYSTREATHYTEQKTRYSLHGVHLEGSIGSGSSPSVVLFPGLIKLSNHSKNDRRSAFTLSSVTSLVGWKKSSHKSVKRVVVSTRFISGRFRIRISVILSEVYYNYFTRSIE